MCELEGKSSFCKGVQETLQNYISELSDISSKVEVEESQGKSCAWNVSLQNPEFEFEFDELKDSIFDVFDETREAEFTLLQELVHEGKLTFDEAIVLIIRERAALLGPLNPPNSLGNTSRVLNS